MKKHKILALGLSMLTLASLAGPALAAPKWWNNNRNNDCNRNQYNHIQQGYRNGNLNRWEAARLYQGERRLDRAERIARADGRINPWEARRLNQMQAQQNRAYRWDMNNRQYRY